jgi:hypothetical protein
MSSLPAPTLESALQTVHDVYVQLLRDSPIEEARATEDDLLGRLASRVPLDRDGGIPLQDGSRLFVGPERGDRSEETGRLGAVQRFPDDRPERIHLIAP